MATTSIYKLIVSSLEKSLAKPELSLGCRKILRRRLRLWQRRKREHIYVIHYMEVKRC